MNNYNNNIVTATDTYKFCGHPSMLPANTEVVQSYFEARLGAKFPSTVWTGLQPIMMEFLCGVVVTKEKVDKAERLASRHVQNGKKIFNRERWDYIIEKHGGRLPIRINAVPEGTLVPVSNVMMTIENTGGKKTAWLTNHLETILTHVWSSCTVATLSYYTKELFKKYLNETCDDGENFGGLEFMLHDFGFRGVSSYMSAGFSGASHLINFLGTDTIVAMETVEDYYGGVEIGNSVVATEHSIMTARGRDGEEGVVDQLFNEFPTGILSIVCDSYDWKNFVDNIIGDEFRDTVLNRDGKTVVRPDSGEPNEVMRYILNSLWKNFGGTINNRGYKVLNPKVGVIWGDGIDMDGIEGILEMAKEAGFSAENLCFGMGGGLLQKINRDTQRFAFKASAHYRDGMWHDVYKDPIDSSKQSKRGRQRLIKIGGEFATTNSRDPFIKDELVTVFENGELVNPIDFNQVRENLKQSS